MNAFKHSGQKFRLGFQDFLRLSIKTGARNMATWQLSPKQFTSPHVNHIKLLSYLSSTFQDKVRLNLIDDHLDSHLFLLLLLLLHTIPEIHDLSFTTPSQVTSAPLLVTQVSRSTPHLLPPRRSLTDWALSLLHSKKHTECELINLLNTQGLQQCWFHTVQWTTLIWTV